MKQAVRTPWPWRKESGNSTSGLRSASRAITMKGRAPSQPPTSRCQGLSRSKRW
jgi:hypothetical protein